ncbi:Aminotransferase class IV [Penicillium cosmopolitanum]|uniref:Branched-chain-amino-acid aminotransferase n=1 Tax=Penicillium cosmopolitanum TaxID=1131564 RepID=A0A9W9VZV9_9EURO|nr:Aminotransferase class IV [Penicillium cosmopolitanum]KAJ5392205.1 Aminotransferase class IV [Penicillium cosmopolitanum]
MVTTNLNAWPACRPVHASRLKFKFAADPKVVSRADSVDLLAHKVFTDYMGWADSEKDRFAPMSVSPTVSFLHYSTSCFEMMKVDRKLRLFRSEYNCLIKKPCEVECSKWLSKSCHGEFLRIRPTLIGTDASLGFQVPSEVLLVMLVSYWPAPTGPPKGLRLLCSGKDAVRSWPGETGSAKVSGNYAPSLLVQGEAKRRGCDLVLWLFEPEGYISETGSANFFVIWRAPQGELQLVTAPLSGHLILGGVTRRSVLDLARERVGEKAGSSSECEKLEVVEKCFTVIDLVEASKCGGLVDAFFVGTACFMQPVVHIMEKAPHVSIIRSRIKDIMFGHEDNAWADEITEEQRDNNRGKD